MRKVTPKALLSVLKQTAKGFSDDKVPKLSASLAYYTIFSLAPLLVVLIFLTSFFFKREALEGSIYGQLRGFVGAEPALQIQEIVKNASLSGESTFAATVGILTLLVGATTVFGEIQDSINSIWGIRAKAKSGIAKLLKDRLLSFGIIGSLGFLLLVSLLVTTLVEGLNERLQRIFPEVTFIVFYIINLLITLTVVTTLFGVIFKVLPDAKIKWKDVLAGAIATAVLFMIGKFLIALYVSKSSIANSYGAAGSFVVLLVWIYYSSFILYFGAEFTKAWAIKFGSEIRPTEYAVLIKRIELESASTSIQENHHETIRHQEKLQRKEDGNAPPPPPSNDQTVPVDLPKKSSPDDGKKVIGMATVVGGLLLYFINSHSKK